MVTLVSIEPASLALTPGQVGTVSLIVRNDGADTETYHLSATGEAADDVIVEPGTLRIRPGKTGTATATITLTPAGRWPVGRVVVGFDVTAAADPDDRTAAEAVIAVRPVSEIEAALSPTSVEGRRSDEIDILIANSGNAHAYADLTVDAAGLAVTIDRRRVTIPADSTESVELGIRPRRILWRGEPVEHPFLVTVSPEAAPPLRLAGTFTQLPVLSRRAFPAVLAVAAALVVLAVVWVAGLAWNTAFGPDAASPSPSDGTSSPAPVEISVQLATTDVGQAGDDVVAVLGAEADEVPDGALVAVAVEWPDGLTLADSTCDRWIGPEIDRELRASPRTGDECLIDPSGAAGEVELTFATPPSGFSGEVAATASRLVTITDGEVQDVETGDGSTYGQASVPVAVEPYPFWLEVAIAEPSEFDDGTREATIGVHRTLSGDGNDESARLAFELLPPGFAELDFLDGCDDFGANDATCVLFFGSDLDFWEVTATFDIDDGPPDAGPVIVEAVELEIDGEPVPSSELREQVRGAEAMLIAVDDLFQIDVGLDTEEAEAGQPVTATVSVMHTPMPSDVEVLRDGSWVLGIELSWPESLVLNGEPQGCASFDGVVCELPGPAEGGNSVVTLRFTVAEDVFDGGEVAGSGARLIYDPTTEADELDGRTRPPVEFSAEWIGSDAEEFSPF